MMPAWIHSLISRMALVPHLRHDLRVRESHIAQHARFVYGISERLLNIDVFPTLHRGLGGYRVKMVGSRDHYSIDVLLLVQHFAEVRVASGFVELLLERDAFRPVLLLVVLELLRDFALGVAEIDVGERDEILRLRELERVLGSHPAKADDSEVHRVTRRLEPDSAEDVTRHDHDPEPDLAGVSDELAPRDLLVLHEMLSPVLCVSSTGRDQYLRACRY